MLYVEPRPASHHQAGDDVTSDIDDDDLDEKEEDKEEKKTLKARLQAIQVKFIFIFYMLNLWTAPEVNDVENSPVSY